MGSIPGWGRCPGGGHGNPLQYCCLENPTARGVWLAVVHRVRESQTRLKWLSTQSSEHDVLEVLNPISVVGQKNKVVLCFQARHIASLSVCLPSVTCRSLPTGLRKPPPAWIPGWLYGMEPTPLSSIQLDLHVWEINLYWVRDCRVCYSRKYFLN